jgi:hypothetical protein
MRKLSYGIILFDAVLICGCFNNNHKCPVADFVPGGELTDEQTFGPYTVKTYFMDRGSFEVLKRGRRIYSQHGGKFWIGVLEKGRLRCTAKNMDLTGNGKANLVVSEWTGGAHCCYNSFVFELNPRFHLLATIHGNDSIPRFEDLDEDSDYEVILHDWTYAYWPGSFASSPAPRVILSWNGKKYIVASELMHFPKPSGQQLQTRAKEIHALWGKEYDRWSIPVELWGYSLELMYAGYEDLGWQFIEMAWTDKHALDLELLQELRSLMAKSPYWKELQQQHSIRSKLLN